MKLAISNIAWDPIEDDSVGAVLRRSGVGAVELAPTKYWPAPCDPPPGAVAEVRARWSDRGQRVAALQSLLFGRPELSIFGDEPTRRVTAEYLTRILEIAAELGAVPLVFGSPRNRDKGDRPFAQAVTEAADFLRPLARRAADLGCVIGFEPNPVAYQCNFGTNLAEALAVVEAVDHPGVALHLDLGILHMNGEPVAEAVRSARDKMVHVHISEPQLAAVPAGQVDHHAAADALRNTHWDGFVSIEMRGGTDGGNVERVRKAVEFAREVYHA